MTLSVHRIIEQLVAHKPDLVILQSKLSDYDAQQLERSSKLLTRELSGILSLLQDSLDVFNKIIALNHENKLPEQELRSHIDNSYKDIFNARYKLNTLYDSLANTKSYDDATAKLADDLGDVLGEIKEVYADSIESAYDELAFFDHLPIRYIYTNAIKDCSEEELEVNYRKVLKANVDYFSSLFLPDDSTPRICDEAIQARIFKLAEKLDTTLLELDIQSLEHDKSVHVEYLDQLASSISNLILQPINSKQILDWVRGREPNDGFMNKLKDQIIVSTKPVSKYIELIISLYKLRFNYNNASFDAFEMSFNNLVRAHNLADFDPAPLQSKKIRPFTVLCQNLCDHSLEVLSYQLKQASEEFASIRNQPAVKKNIHELSIFRDNLLTNPIDANGELLSDQILDDLYQRYKSLLQEIDYSHLTNQVSYRQENTSPKRSTLGIDDTGDQSKAFKDYISQSILNLQANKNLSFWLLLGELGNVSLKINAIDLNKTKELMTILTLALLHK